MDPEHDETPTDGTDDTGTDTGANGRTFSQAEVDKLLARTRNEGSRAASKAAAEALGMSIDDAKALIAARKAAEEAELTEAQRAKADAEQARAEANRIVEQARAAQLRADATVALLGGDNPLNRDRLDLALRVVLPDVIGSDDEDALPSAIETLRGQSPEWFRPTMSTDEATRRGTPAPTLPGRKVNERSGGPQTAQDRARALWEERKARSRPPMPTP